MFYLISYYSIIAGTFRRCLTCPILHLNIRKTVENSSATENAVVKSFKNKPFLTQPRPEVPSKPLYQSKSHSIVEQNSSQITSIGNDQNMQNTTFNSLPVETKSGINVAFLNEVYTGTIKQHTSSHTSNGETQVTTLESMSKSIIY